MNSLPSNADCPHCGAPLPEGAPGGQCPKCLLAAAAAPTLAEAAEPEPWPALDEVRAAFPDLDVERELGRGGMAVVYLARQRRLDRPVALKILAPSLAAQPGFAERFTREARVLARLNHPNIVTIHDFGHAARFFYLLMEYVDGPNLRQAMQAGRFPPEQALALVPRLCDALQYAHGEGVLHRDIKPDNILLDRRGRVKVADFGIAKLAGEPAAARTLTRSGMHLGTPAYMAPEQVEKPAEVDHRADIYSLGVVVYEMLTGELPLGRFPAPSEKAGVDARVDAIVLRALEKERELRFQTAEEVKTRVEGLGAAPPTAPDPVPAACDFPPLSRKALYGAIATGASIVAVVLPVVGYQLLVDQTAPPVTADVTVLGKLLALVVVVSAAIAGIILGASGLADIRASRGRWRGAGFGTFASLGWPLLLLTVVTAAVAAAVGRELFAHRPSPTPGGILLAATFSASLAAVLWLDFRIVRRTLRWALCQETPPTPDARPHE